MLDKSKLIAQLQGIADKLFFDNSSASIYAKELWHVISNDSSFFYKVQNVVNPPWPVPLWTGDLGEVISINRQSFPHMVLSVDGSQIYPDRHFFGSCFLINTGHVTLPYLLPNAKVSFSSTPIVFTGDDETPLSCTTDMVNCKRQELELQNGLKLALDMQHDYKDIPTILLFDGSLIFWHLLSKEEEMRDMFLHTYCDLLEQLYQARIVTAWYISSPKSKELVNLLRLYLSDFEPSKKESYACINTILDSTIMNTFLEPYSRSILFKNCSNVTVFYPPHVRPFFFYINTGNEIGRVEIPSWIAQDETLVDCIARVIIDQCIKGGGYPVALAEAHEQAVIKGPDREFFYHFLQKMVIEQGRNISASRKSLKKRGMNV